ncbi:TetR/AcrR family transcriptional regulator [Microbacterium sp. nov. GSS16]|uniref:TetR/AcrR family transcriptional regulator n=1 Tax=Microbacterium sp. nov. GSS16 TaxID=3019890 RepID=UPI002306794A|nr:TetR/AcrR family transcriptional regulator [Microbacterium sp. nov. GSS16]MEE2815555.1 helix-turn-helix domain-containing protein [Actinomycetota bacterium]WCD92971.1 helix-turn-helix domain containing protein [Microbacterium sp. nov. GSS16]
MSTTRSRENTRARLLEAAAQVFAEVGLEGATVEAVCERAGFTRGAFYSNFESKDALFLELAASVGEARLQAVRERVSALVGQNAIDDCDPADLVQQIMDSGADDRVGVMMMSEIRIRALRDPSFGAAYLAQENEMMQSIVAIIQEIVDSGQIALRIDAEEAARLLMIVWEGMSVRAAMNGDDSDRLRRTGSEALGRMVELIRL